MNLASTIKMMAEKKDAPPFDVSVPAVVWFSCVIRSVGQVVPALQVDDIDEAR